MADSEQHEGVVGKYRLIYELAGSRYAWFSVVLLLGGPILAFITQDIMVMFYTHVTIAAFWLGLDFFFKYVMAPAIDKSGPETAASLMPNLTPRIMIAGEGATLGTIGSGIALAYEMGWLHSPNEFVWGALAGAAVMIVIAFGPLHHLQSEILVELESDAPDGPRIGQLTDKATMWAQVMTILMLFMIFMMTGLRGFVYWPF